MTSSMDLMHYFHVFSSKNYFKKQQQPHPPLIHRDKRGWPFVLLLLLLKQHLYMYMHGKSSKCLDCFFLIGVHSAACLSKLYYASHFAMQHASTPNNLVACKGKLTRKTTNKLGSYNLLVTCFILIQSRQGSKVVCKIIHTAKFPSGIWSQLFLSAHKQQQISILNRSICSIQCQLSFPSDSKEKRIQA